MNRALISSQKTPVRATYQGMGFPQKLHRTRVENHISGDSKEEAEGQEK
jgi:hypothetical protein